MDRLKDELNLSETQMQQMDEIMSSFEPMPLPRAREDGMKREGRRQFMRDRIFEMEQKVEEILTPEQMEKYRQMRARRYYMRPRGAERPSPSFDFPMPEPPE
jgi:Spy/CpxP family protein refolding chaperone